MAETYNLARNNPPRMALSSHPENMEIAICFIAARLLCRIYELNQTLPAWWPLPTMHNKALAIVRGRLPDELENSHIGEKSHMETGP